MAAQHLHPNQPEPPLLIREVFRIYVSFPFACGAGGPFTQPLLKCDREDAAARARCALDHLKDLLEGKNATPGVPFGFELETSMQMPYTGDERTHKLASVAAYFAGERTPEVYKAMQDMYEQPEYGRSIQAVKTCFHRATGGQFNTWRWEDEGGPLPKPQDVDNPEEMWGLPIEFTAADPPELQGQQGLRAMVTALAGLEAVGMQSSAGDSLHVHVRVREAKAWSDRDVAFFWAGWVRAQYVIDQFVQSHTLCKKQGAGLYLWDPKVQYLFRNLHRLLKGAEIGQTTPLKELCDFILGEGECDTSSGSWPSKHTPFRHYALNFATLYRFSSIEVRQYGAVLSPEQGGHWLDLTLRMAASFSQDERLLAFFDQDEETDLKQLHEAQESMQLQDLLDQVALPPSSQGFFEGQHWARDEGGAWRSHCA